MIETREKVIDGDNYMVTQLPARKALKVQTKLIKIFGGVALSFGSVAKKDSDSEEEKQLKDKLAIESFQKSCQCIDPDQLVELCESMLEGVRKNGLELTPHLFDKEFAGNIIGVYKLLLFIIEVNFSNFFSLLGIGLPSLEENHQEFSQGTKKTFTKA